MSVGGKQRRRKLKQIEERKAQYLGGRGQTGFGHKDEFVCIWATTLTTALSINIALA